MLSDSTQPQPENPDGPACPALRGLLQAGSLQLDDQQRAELSTIEALDAEAVRALLVTNCMSKQPERAAVKRTEERADEPAVEAKKRRQPEEHTQADEEDESASGPLVDRYVQGHKVRLTQEDYDRFVRNDKWASCEFFRFVPSNVERGCEFCKIKCKTVTDGVYMCAACRHFAHKSLVKHHMFVCKGQEAQSGIDEDMEDRCNDLAKVKQVPQDLFCRYCFFKQIVIKLPSLNRLQKFMIEFINRRLMFVNSVSQKSMLWKDRIASTLKKKAPSLLFQAASAANSGVKVLQSKTTNIATKQLKSSAAGSANNRLKQLRLGRNKALKIPRNVVLGSLGAGNKNKRPLERFKPGRARERAESSGASEESEPESPAVVASPLLEDEDPFLLEEIEENKENDSGVRSPRVKHVSREQPKSLGLKLAAGVQRANLISYIKMLNEDLLLETPQISWTTTCLDFNFNLSTLPLSTKLGIQRKHEERMSRLRAAAPASPGRHSSDDYRPGRSASMRTGGARNSRDEASGGRDELGHARSSRTHSSDGLRLNKDKSMKFIRSCHYLKSFEGAAQSQQQTSTSAGNFNWDEYFEKNHKISTNQNIRYSSLTASNEPGSAATTVSTFDPIGRKSSRSAGGADAGSGGSSFADPLADKSDNQAITSSTKRLSGNLNSYKDRTRLYSDHPLKKNFLDVSNISNSADSLVVSSIDNLNKNYYESLHQNVLIWDIAIEYDQYNLWKHGLAIADKKPLPFKSICFTCASDHASESNPLIYCSTCCEPTHQACLPENEAPRPDRSLINWTCSKCKFCEVCKQQNQLVTCAKCDNSYHSNCFKNKNYPPKSSKKSKIWICGDCFKCKSCQSSDMGYDKKTFLKMLTYDFSLCFKCLRQTQLGYYCKTCSGVFDESAASTSNDLLACQHCKHWYHLKCLETASNEDQYLFKDAEFKFECRECCGSDENFDAHAAEFKTRTLKAIVNDLRSVVTRRESSPELKHEEQDLSADIELVSALSAEIKEEIKEEPDLLAAFLDAYQPDRVVDLATALNGLFNDAWSRLVDQSRRVELRDKLKSVVDGRLERFSDLFDVFKIREAPPLPTPQPTPEPVAPVQEPSSAAPDEPMPTATEATLQQTPEQQAKSESARIASATNMLAEKKKKCAVEELVKVPYEDHTYAISASSIALALQSSNIFNQNNAQANNNDAYVDLKKKLQSSDTKHAGREPLPNPGEFDDVFRAFENVTGPDDRECLLCHGVGECAAGGRLVSVDTSYWVHANCALWSDDTYLDEERVVKQIHLVFNKVKSSICTHCKRDGASISCSHSSCGAVYHFKCAQAVRAILTSSLLSAEQAAAIKAAGRIDHSERLRLLAARNGASLFCANHTNAKIPHKDLNLFELDVGARFEGPLFVELRDEAWRKKNGFPWFTVKENFSDLNLLIGAVQIKRIGDLDTISDYDHYLCPINYEASRLYWSTFKLGVKVLYTLRIRRVAPKLVGEVLEVDKSAPLAPPQTSSLDETLAAVGKLDATQEPEPEQAIVIPAIAQTDGNSDEQEPGRIVFTSQSGGGQESGSFGAAIKKPIITLNRQLGSNLIKLSTGFKNFKIVKPPSAPGEPEIAVFRSSADLFRSTPQGAANGLHRAPVGLLQVPAVPAMTPLNIKILDKHQQQQEHLMTISPKSDRSDSSLNLDHSSRIINPIYSGSFDRAPHSNRSAEVKPSPTTTERTSPRVISPKSTSPKTGAAAGKPTKTAVGSASKKPASSKPAKSPKKFNPNKQITVAALLSASYSAVKSAETDSSTSDLQPVMMMMKPSFRATEAAPPPPEPVRLETPEPPQPSSQSLDDIDRSISNLIESVAREPEAVPTTETKKKPAKRAPAEPARKIRHIPAAGRREPDRHHGSDTRERLVFEVTSEDGFYFQSDDINKAWRAVTDRVKKLRAAHKLKELSYKPLNGFLAFGLDSKYLKFVLERLDSIQFCESYRKRNCLSLEGVDAKWRITDGAARTVLPFAGAKKHTDAFYWLSSEYRDLASISRLNLFDQSFLQARKALISSDMFNSMKYRHLKEFSKNSLIVKKSGIHGRGLFTLVDIYQSQMIIEYAGEIIRHQLCDKREKYYETKNIGCYMFKIDEFEVIDATSRGNQARFINHSCDPNCVSKVLIIQGQKHIIIFAHRFIQKGEELTYDYKFPKEDLKIECFCKSSKCRKYLN